MTSVLVVGAGVGGIAVAARLARRGCDVTVLEKTAAPGGRCNQIVQDGHRFDVGPSLFLLPQVYAQTYADLGERIDDHLDMRRIDPTYHIHFEDETELKLSADVSWMQDQLEAIEPGSFGGFLRYMAEGYRHLDIALERFLTTGQHFQYLKSFDPIHPRFSTGFNTVKEVLTFQNQRFRGQDGNSLRLSRVWYRFLPYPVYLMAVDGKLLFRGGAIKFGHAFIADNDKPLFFERMKPGNKDMGLKAGLEFDMGGSHIGDFLMQVVSACCLDTFRLFSCNCQNHGNVMRCK